MIIGDRLRELRDGKKLSQGDIEKGKGLVALTFLASKIILLFRLSIHWRRWHGP